MLKSIWDDMNREFRYGTAVTRIIIVNVIVFVVFVMAQIIIKGINPTLYQDMLHFFCMSALPIELLTHPWGLLTSLFLHQDFGHILWNMLAFFWFGRVVGDLLGDHRILPLYLLGGIAGNVLFFVSSQFIPLSFYSLGASGAVMAMMACGAYIAPNYRFNVLLIGPVKLQYIALALIILDLLSVSQNSNTGGHIAHLGGAAMGFFFGYALQNGIAIDKPINQIIFFFKRLFSLTPPKKVVKRPFQTAQTGQNRPKMARTEGGASDEDRLDKILEKIKDKGYDSLTAEEKKFLFDASNRS